MSNKQDAIDQVVELCRQHAITAQEVADALSNTSTCVQAQTGSVMGRVFAYLGATFIFAGIAAFVGMFWDEMSPPMRIAVTFGTGFVIYLFAIISSAQEQFRRHAAAMVMMACLLQPTGLFVAIDEYFNSGSDPRYATLFVFSFMFIQQCTAFYARRLSSLLFMSMFFGYAVYVNILDLAETDNTLIFFTLGASVLCITYGLRNTVHAAITPIWNLLGACCVLGSLFDYLENTPVEMLYLGACAGMMYLSTLMRSRMLLTVSTLAMLGYISYFTAEHFMNSVGWPITLILLGGMFIGIGSMAMKISKKYITK